MQRARLDELANLGRWPQLGSVEVTGDDPVLPTAWPVGEVAAVAVSQVGDAAARLSLMAGGEPGLTRVDVTTAVAATTWCAPRLPVTLGSAPSTWGRG